MINKLVSNQTTNVIDLDFDIDFTPFSSGLVGGIGGAQKYGASYGCVRRVSVRFLTAFWVKGFIVTSTQLDSTRRNHNVTYFHPQDQVYCTLYAKLSVVFPPNSPVPFYPSSPSTSSAEKTEERVGHLAEEKIWNGISVVFL